MADQVIHQEPELVKDAWHLLKISGALSDKFRGFWGMADTHRNKFIEIHNQLFPERKENAHCPPCIMRAISRFKTKYLDQKPEGY